MLKHDARGFYEVTIALQRIRLAIAGHSSMTEEPDGSVTVHLLSDSVFENELRSNIDELRSGLAALGAVRITPQIVDELEAEIEGDLLTYESLRDALDEIDRTLRRELSLVALLALQPNEQNYYEPKEPLFGKEFEAKFPTGLFELDEAAKCFALSRYTACAFHLLRLIEIGLKSVAACIGATLPSGGASRNWGKVIEAVKAKIDERTNAKSWSGEDQEFFEAVHASLNAIRVAWRNPTMHVETKYTADEAEHVFVVVKGFMKKLASRMDEAGEPKA